MSLGPVRTGPDGRPANPLGSITGQSHNGQGRGPDPRTVRSGRILNGHEGRAAARRRDPGLPPRGLRALLESFERRHAALVAAIEDARRRELPIVYANDNHGIWDGDAASLVRRATEAGRAGKLVEAIAPRDGDRFVVKPRYSAFDHTPLEHVLRELEIERVLLAGAATEMCVIQTAIDANEAGLKVTILADACSPPTSAWRRLRSSTPSGSWAPSSSGASC
jgi:nicotinamidase-related amidase